MKILLLSKTETDLLPDFCFQSVQSSFRGGRLITELWKSVPLQNWASVRFLPSGDPGCPIPIPIPSQLLARRTDRSTIFTLLRLTFSEPWSIGLEFKTCLWPQNISTSQTKRCCLISASLSHQHFCQQLERTTFVPGCASSLLYCRSCFALGLPDSERWRSLFRVELNRSRILTRPVFKVKYLVQRFRWTWTFFSLIENSIIVLLCGRFLIDKP